MGKWLGYGTWYPDCKLRLFMKSKAEITGMEPHDRVVLKEGEAGRLSGDILHYSYKDITAQINTLNRYSSLQAAAMREKGVGSPLARMVIHSWFSFLKTFFLKRGFMDGVQGFIMSAATSFYVFLKYAKLWELSRGEK